MSHNALETLLISLLLGTAVSTTAMAQDAPPADPPPTQADDPEKQDGTETDTAADDEDDGLGSLDDLLGLDEGDESSAADATDGEAESALAEPSQEALDAKLRDEAPGEVLEEAVKLMDQTAQRLQVGRDAGLVTQRLQEDILRKLDTLIDQARQQQNQSQSSSSSSQQQQQQQQQPTQQQQQQDQQGQSPEGENQGENAPPSRQGEEFNNLLNSAQAAWGMLPARIRALLMQGLNDQYSEMYGSATEEYYRRIAEEGDSQ